jgi:uncharacterized membrane protein
MASPLYRGQIAARVVLCIFYGGAGIFHLVAADRFLPIVPDWVPMPRETILATGLCEIAGAVGLLLPRWQYAAGVALALYAVCVFPANIKHAFGRIDVPGLPTSWGITGHGFCFSRSSPGPRCLRAT